MTDERWLVAIGVGVAALWWMRRQRQQAAAVLQVAIPSPALPPVTGVLAAPLHPGGSGNALLSPHPAQDAFGNPWCPPGMTWQPYKSGYGGTCVSAFSDDKCGCTAKGMVNSGLGACVCVPRTSQGL